MMMTGVAASRQTIFAPQASPSESFPELNGRDKKESQQKEPTYKSMAVTEMTVLCYPADLNLSKYSLPQLLLQSTMTLEELRRISIESNEGVVKATTSRHGQTLQRFLETTSEYVHARQGDKARLTTGTVPILKDGRIILVSSRKSGWVLPKGGWEGDETLPVGAIRETFEEAGVVGLLGPPLPTITYETKKARRRRLASTSAESLSSSLMEESSVSVTYYSDTETSLSGVSSKSRSCGELAKLNGSQSHELPSLAAKKDHTHNCMTLFPLYVQQVYELWPESDRLRRAFTIEEAEVVLAERPEFVSVLQVVKEHRLHRVCIDDIIASTVEDASAT